jgi:hypothetical protein
MLPQERIEAAAYAFIKAVLEVDTWVGSSSSGRELMQVATTELLGLSPNFPRDDGRLKWREPITLKGDDNIIDMRLQMASHLATLFLWHPEPVRVLKFWAQIPTQRRVSDEALVILDQLLAEAGL